REGRRVGLLEGLPFELEMRALFKSGQYRWQLVQYDPLKDEHGRVIHWYVTGTDIDDQKKTEERLRNENHVLRAEIDRSWMSVRRWMVRRCGRRWSVPRSPFARC